MNVLGRWAMVCDSERTANCNGAVLSKNVQREKAQKVNNPVDRIGWKCSGLASPKDLQILTPY